MMKDRSQNNSLENQKGKKIKNDFIRFIRIFIEIIL